MNLTPAARNALAMLAVIGVLGACAKATPPPPTEISFSHLGTIKLDVARVEIVNEYESPLKAPNVEHEFPVTPAAAARRWVEDRIRAVGDSGAVRAIIREASVVEVALEKKGGVVGFFTKDQAERYDAKLVMEIEVVSERGFTDAFVTATATRSQTVPEGITLNERGKVFHDMTEKLMGDLNFQLERQINVHLVKFLR